VVQQHSFPSGKGTFSQCYPIVTGQVMWNSSDWLFCVSLILSYKKGWRLSQDADRDSNSGTLVWIPKSQITILKVFQTAFKPGFFTIGLISDHRKRMK